MGTTVQMRTRYASPGRSFAPGSVLVVGDSEARMLIEGGFASKCPVEETPPEGKKVKAEKAKE